ncbi:hypothetical protein MPDQ_003982 [Monascus purpureus]|uniref:Amidase domain-containing protein n=1 Tax=Monascus purpureus TaxID=5098 RepID=A0A507R2I7_MONPU|nr:hypothetical protein MPDQ_003982 [Monascus purpureus]
MPTCCGIDIEDLSIVQLQQYLAHGAFSIRALTSCYLERITRLNPLLRAVIEVNPDALDIADELDKERAMEQVRSPLHGIPFLVKDNIATKDRMHTTAGTTMLVGAKVPDDAHVVSLLRSAGAVLLGHANLSEWASMRSSYYSEAYSSRGGQCRNPYNLAYHPGGSSNGSAVAVATNMCAFSLGTETDGSVVFPADRNGVVGIKPTVGLVSCQGVIPECSSLDTVGTLARTVKDAAIVLDCITKSFVSEQQYTSYISGQEALEGARFGLPWKGVWEMASKNKSLKAQYSRLGEVIQRIKDAGAEVIENTDFPSAEEIISPKGWDWEFPEDRPHQSEFTVVKTEFYNHLKTYLAGLTSNPNNIHSLEDVIAYNMKYTEKEGGRPGTHPAWPKGQANFEKSLESKGVMDDTYYKALAYIRRKSREEGIDAALSCGGLQLDGLLVPVQAETGVACQVAAKAGYPMITVPVGVDDQGIAFGIGIIQTSRREDMLIKYGSAIESLIQGRTRPQFLNIHADNYMYVGDGPK